MGFLDYFKKNKNVDDYMKKLEKCIEEFAYMGEIKNIKIVYSSFIMGNRSVIDSASIALCRYVNELNDEQLMNLKKQFKNMTSMEWSINWQEIEPCKIVKSLNSDEEIISFLGVGTFHPNGYYREKCLIELKKYGEKGLPYIILCLNDWVEQIRDRAYPIVVDNLSNMEINELLEFMTYFERIKVSERVGNEVFNSIYLLIENKFIKEFNLISLTDIYKLNKNGRRFCYEIIFDKCELNFDSVLMLFKREHDHHIRKSIVKNYLNNNDLNELELEQLLNLKNCEVRLLAIKKWYSMKNNVWIGLEKHLLDVSIKVRDFSRFIFRQHKSLNFEEFYLSNIENHTYASICGIGEVSNNENYIVNIKNYLQSDNVKIIKATLKTIDKLSSNIDQELFYKYIFDERRGVAKTAYLVLNSYKMCVDCKRLYHDLEYESFDYIRLHLFRLICKANKYELLPYLMKINTNENLKEFKIETDEFLKNWWFGYEKPNKNQAKIINVEFEIQKEKLSKKAIENLSFCIARF